MAMKTSNIIKTDATSPKAIITDADYRTWIRDIASRYRQSQIRAAVRVNSEMLHYYWQLGADIHNRQFENRYGSRFYANASRDLRAELGVNEGLSETTLKYTKYFYELYAPLFPNRQQVVDDFSSQILQQVAEELQTTDNERNTNRQQVADGFPSLIRGQLIDDFDLLFQIPWSHHVNIIDKVKGDPHKALFFVKKSLQNQWGRALLLNFLSTDIYERQHEELNNFQATLPSPDSDLARQMIQSHYNWEFLQLNERYNETQLKDALCNNIIRTLISLGRGFSFLGREYRLEAPGIEKFIDLLFYIVPLHRYCVVEVKTTRFDFPDVGQITGYVNMVNDLLNTSVEQPAIGLLICKEKNTILARYALQGLTTPIGIADYQVTTQELPEELQGYLPTYQELEHILTQNAPHIPEEDNQDKESPTAG